MFPGPLTYRVITLSSPILTRPRPPQPDIKRAGCYSPRPLDLWQFVHAGHGCLPPRAWYCSVRPGSIMIPFPFPCRCLIPDHAIGPQVRHTNFHIVPARLQGARDVRTKRRLPWQQMCISLERADIVHEPMTSTSPSWTEALVMLWKCTRKNRPAVSAGAVTSIVADGWSVFVKSFSGRQIFWSSEISIW